MTPAVIAVLTLTGIGIPFVLLLDRDASPLRVIGLAFLYGSGAIYLVLLLLSVAGARWSVLTVGVAALAFWSAAAMPPLLHR